MIRKVYLETAAVAVDLLREPAVAGQWAAPSALAEFAVSGLAGHLARQVLAVPSLLAAPAPDELPITLAEHFARSAWVGADVDTEVSRGIRQASDELAAGGAADLVGRTAVTLAELESLLATQPADRVLHLPYAPWALALDDYLTTRVLELVVHCDDLAYSVGLPTPPLPAAAVDEVVTLLARLAVHRHGATAVLRALSRAERAPASIAAI